MGSLEILGSPVSLVRSIGTGVADFFRLPYEGLTRGPGAFVSGVSRGTSSFVKHISKGNQPPGWAARPFFQPPAPAGAREHSAICWRPRSVTRGSPLEGGRWAAGSPFAGSALTPSSARAGSRGLLKDSEEGLNLNLESPRPWSRASKRPTTAGTRNWFPTWTQGWPHHVRCLDLGGFRDLYLGKNPTLGLTCASSLCRVQVYMCVEAPTGACVSMCVQACV